MDTIKLHIALRGTLLFCAGIILSFLLHPPLFIIVSLTVVSSLLLLYALIKASANNTLLNTLAAYLFFLSWGALLFLLSPQPALPLFVQNRMQDIEVKGIVQQTSLENSGGFYFDLRLQTIEYEDTILLSDKIVRIKIERDSSASFSRLYNKVLPGATVLATGDYIFSVKRRNPGEFNYGAYLAGQGISGVIYAESDTSVIVLTEAGAGFSSWLTKARRVLHQNIYRLHTPQTAALLSGLLIGERGDINQEVITDFRNSGIIHILAVSGTNVAAVVLLLYLLFGRFTLTVRIILTIIGLGIFVFISGASSSVIRAALMAVMILTGKRLERRNDTLAIVMGSAFLILLFDARQLFDPGFQLSYSAVLSIVLLVPSFEKLFNVQAIKTKYLKAVIKLFIVSLAAQIGMLPFIAYYYGMVSVAGLLLNIIAVPLSTFLLFNGIITLLVSSVWVLPAYYYAGSSELFTRIINASASYAAHRQYSYFVLPGFSVHASLVYYFLLALLCTAVAVSSKKLFAPAVAIAVVCLFIFLYPAVKTTYLPEGKLSVLAVDVGQGDAILVQFPDNTTMLIDAGPRTAGFDTGERTIIPLLNYLGLKTIDLFVISHPDMDHIGGAYTLVAEKKVRRILKNESSITDRNGAVLEKVAAHSGIPVQMFDDSVMYGNNYRVYFLNNPGETSAQTFEKTNEQSCAVKIQYGSIGILLCGDSEKGMESYMFRRYGNFLEAEVLKSNHHGSKTSSSKEFLDFVSPQSVIISCGENNSYKHPSVQVLREYNGRKIAVYRTDKKGAVVLHSSGNGYEIKQY